MSQLRGGLGTLDGTVQQLTVVHTSFPTPCVDSVQLQAPTGNSGTIYVGVATMTATTDASAIVPPGAALSFSARPGSFLDASKSYILGTNNDKVWISYIL